MKNPNDAQLDAINAVRRRYGAPLVARLPAELDLRPAATPAPPPIMPGFRHGIVEGREPPLPPEPSAVYVMEEGLGSAPTIAVLVFGVIVMIIVIVLSGLRPA